ncbi:bifunctional DNA-formamidopyrimidine glycosylase/DNA-(apurinic or apyrimidinic site) lyase [Erythrobacter litoralis]|uniref:Formamidopyrimidine-DNA glycosylase n=1 Tax=Erythrobacter litoralis (strain HTCC2594) TaxID=314225 RepID=FPG_ERYLH|nr:bifunctional DNA-formamidopyrimidine glycosylase/DNA-(apurinic or apyrimidinic site) lyase [Erythrobacter litoralis]Q2N7Y8.1 RecName: Full=Formamidopyrimidine-DNA glycosylase; Short=Fapy-DNA glycosylase; AltName: Full=DNA-(apurinic or apyrimidinic site) lyase MutM; Short=AP lyase MutM [Erythrobacter litoralis HTCC2594]ABC64203.1 formamidopyrimidine-DNA glycosylase [Erythrobacter litoralis HTCC2594]
MPELPEVETTVRGLARFLQGERITRTVTNRPDMRFPFPDGLGQALTGATVVSLGRRAKYGLIHTDRDQTMIFHLGMSGRWRIDPDETDKHDHLLIETADHRFALCDPRRFGWVDLVGTQALDQWPGFAAMGPEPLGDALTIEHLRAALSGRKQAIKLCLLDQAIVAGLGNIYVCEALWHARIHPRKAGGRVSKQALSLLITAIRDVLEQSIRDGGSSLRDYAQPDGELGYFATRFQVYGRDGQPCHRDDGGTIRRFAQGGRSTWYCPRCQR